MGLMRSQRVRELAESLYGHQIAEILETGRLTDPFGTLRRPTESGRAVIVHVLRAHGRDQAESPDAESR
jgi:hypothetical protein